MCPLAGRVCWQRAGSLSGNGFIHAVDELLMLVMIVPSPARPVLPLPSVSDRSAIQRAERGDRFPLGRVPEGAPRAAQSTAAMPQLRPSQAQWALSCPARGQRGGRTQTSCSSSASPVCLGSACPAPWPCAPVSGAPSQSVLSHSPS